MALKIQQDHSRFRQIVRGKIKQNLRKYVSQGEMLGRQGKDTISIPVPSIDLPRFVFDHRDTGGVGQGQGEVGDVLQPGNVDQGQGGQGEAGSDPGDHSLEVEVTLDELAEMLGEALELPKIEPKGSERIVSQKTKYTGVRRAGPESLRQDRRAHV